MNTACGIWFCLLLNLFRGSSKQQHHRGDGSGGMFVSSQTPPSGTATFRIELKPITTTRLRRPAGLIYAGDKKKQLYVVQQDGFIRIMKSDTGEVVEDPPFLDISSRVEVRSSGYTEMGLLGLAFHPKYKRNGLFFVNYTTKIGNQRYTRVSRFERSKDEYYQADPASERILLEYQQPYTNHNGGDMAFSPDDGLLYISSGDGGSANDPQNFGQNLNSFLGKILRIDVDETTTDRNYTIPSNNPFASSSSISFSGVQQEIYSYGVRNPWKLAFDRKNGDFYFADVGQNKWEEINYQPAADNDGGQDYGWSKMEGTSCFNPRFGCDPNNEITLPVLEYEHENGYCCVVGGYVYRGKKNPKWKGHYFYTDYCTGTIWAAKRDPVDNTFTTNIVSSANPGLNIGSFGEDAKGELYVVGHGSETVYRMIDTCKDNKEFRHATKKKSFSCKAIRKLKSKKKKRKLCNVSDVQQNCQSTCGQC